MDTYGTRARVWHKKAKKTRGGLTRNDLKKNKWGRIVSKKQSLRAKKEQRLKKAGYYTQKGKFGTVKRPVKTKKKKQSK